METQTGKKIKVLRSDNGGEYTNDPSCKYARMRDCLTFHRKRDTATKWGSLRMNRTLLEKVRCMLSNAGLGKVFWAEEISYACYLINRLPSAAIEENTIGSLVRRNC